MSLTVNARGIAEAKIQGLTLLPVIGAYELLFGLDIMVHPHAPGDFARQASVLGARVNLTAGGKRPLGFARPEARLDITQGAYPNRMTPALVMTLQPGQLAAIEQLRDRGDVGFELVLAGTGLDHHGQHDLREEWRIHIPRSEWLDKLRNAGARNVLLLEITLPLVDQPPTWIEVAKNLLQAEICFRDGDHRGSIAACRIALEELGHHKFGRKGWAAPLLERLAKERQSMTVAEREASLLATVMHYTHQAHHGGSEGGISHYSRDDALLILTMTLSLVRHCKSAD
jgi:hypothetical protein